MKLPSSEWAELFTSSRPRGQQVFFTLPTFSISPESFSWRTGCLRPPGQAVNDFFQLRRLSSRAEFFSQRPGCLRPPGQAVNDFFHLRRLFKSALSLSRGGRAVYFRPTRLSTTLFLLVDLFFNPARGLPCGGRAVYVRPHHLSTGFSFQPQFSCFSPAVRLCRTVPLRASTVP